MTRIGVILTPDNAADADFWRWVPTGVTIHVTRTSLDVFDAQAGPTWVPSEAELVEATQAFRLIHPAVVTLACTSGSFFAGRAAEARIRRTIESAGAPIAQTTSGAVADALAAVGARRVAVATPYDAVTTGRLGSFLEEAGFDIVSLVHEEPGAPDELSEMTADDIRRLASEADRPEADVLFVSCTALETYDLIEELEAALGKPVVTSTQATMWAALRAAGVLAGAHRQKLFASSQAGASVSPAD